MGGVYCVDEVARAVGALSFLLHLSEIPLHIQTYIAIVAGFEDAKVRRYFSEEVGTVAAQTPVLIEFLPVTLDVCRAAQPALLAH